MLKYMKENNLTFQERIDLDEIFNSFNSIKNLINYTDYIDKINYLINSFKCCIQHNQNYNNEGIFFFKLEFFENNDVLDKITLIIQVLIQILNVEWKEGLKLMNKNCLIFNVKLLLI